ncbi:LysR family transcriptional regulator [Streptomyces sp. NBC_01381]|uniref:LysR family transcriptional regulator n=1 Tax=Streptomyces sp. NBC_01381 TaxID=2903845 RepID=UPI0022573F1F|nr:LysR family transcriptional regulator [Streptomyces sp. NBC_01381]MCX4670590.1 LysR family transcriptional regulator [Streptomyces sp. NBC_01381]
MLERTEMEMFLTLAEELHFGRTAERLYCSTGRVSQIIKQMERRVGAPLFERTSRHVELTSVGRRLREDLLPLYEGIRGAMERAEAAGRGITGTLTVGFMGTQSARVLSAAREVFELRNPDCTVRVVETHLHHHTAQLRDGTADLLLITLPVSEPDLTVGAVITRGSRYMALAADHRLTGHDVVSFEDLAGETFVAMAGSVPTYWTDFHLPRTTPGGRPIGRYGEPCATYAEALALVAAGRAIVPGDRQLLSLYGRPDIHFVLVSDMPQVEQGLVWRTRDDADQRVRAFADVVLEIAPALSLPAPTLVPRSTEDTVTPA